MANDEKKPETLSELSQKMSSGEGAPFERESAPVPEKKDLSPFEAPVAEELKREIELMELGADLEVEAKKKAKEIEFLGDQEKIEHLLDLARTKGVVYAVKAGKSMNDPFILDTLHDTLAKEGFYKQFIDAKKT